MSWRGFFELATTTEKKELIQKSEKIIDDCKKSTEFNTFKKQKHKRHRAVNKMCWSRAKAEIKKRDSWLFDSLMKSLEETSEYVDSLKKNTGIKISGYRC